jgi:hypothetical protein
MRIKKERKKERDPKSTPKLQLQHHQHHQKSHDETNLTTPRKVANNNRNGPHMANGSLVIEWKMWPTLITIGNFSCCRWIRLVEIFFMISMVS